MEQTVEQYGEYLYHLSYLYVKDRQLAEEITQDVLLKYAVHKQDFRGEAALKTYLTRILINCCHDELRRQKRRKLLSWLLPRGRNELSAETSYLRGELYQTVKVHVFALPVHYREVIVLFYYEEFTVEEIAMLLAVSENTIRTRIRRARACLKKNRELEGLYYERI